MKKDKFVKYILILPAIIALTIIVIYPLFFNLRLSFTSATIANFRNPTFVGLRNYIGLLTDPIFLNSLRFNFIFVLLAVLVEVFLGSVMAIFIYNLKVKGKSLIILLLVLPLMIAPVFYAVTFKLGLNSLYGVVPYYSNSIGINIDFFKTSNSALLTLMGIDAWQWFPFIFIIVYAGLQALPNETLEAAEVDGANSRQTIIHIIAPMIKPIILIAAILRAIDAFKIFDIIYVLTGGGPGISTRSASIQIYYYNFGQFNFGIASAATFILLIVVAMFFSLSMRYLRLS